MGIATSSIADSSLDDERITECIQEWWMGTEQVESEAIEETRAEPPIHNNSITPLPWVEATRVTSRLLSSVLSRNTSPSNNTNSKMITVRYQWAEEGRSKSFKTLSFDSERFRTVSDLKHEFFRITGIETSRQEIYVHGHSLYMDTYFWVHYERQIELPIVGATIDLFMSDGKLGDVQIYVKALSDRIICLFLSLYTTVDELRRQIRKRSDYFRCDASRLRFQGKFLLDGKIISDYHIKRGSQILEAEELRIDVWQKP